MPQEGEEPVAGFLQPERDLPAPEPPPGQEGLALGLAHDILAASAHLRETARVLDVDNASLVPRAFWIFLKNRDGVTSGGGDGG